MSMMPTALVVDGKWERPRPRSRQLLGGETGGACEPTGSGREAANGPRLSRTDPHAKSIRLGIQQGAGPCRLQALVGLTALHHHLQPAGKCGVGKIKDVHSISLRPDDPKVRKLTQCGERGESDMRV